MSTNDTNEVVVNTTARFIWGCPAISKVINRSERATYHLLKSKKIRSAQKKGGQYVANRDELIAEFSAGE